MAENHQDKPASKLTATEDKLNQQSSKDHKEPSQNTRMGMIKQSLGFFGYDKETREYKPDGQLQTITKEHQPGKTLWDWLNLLGTLAIPLVVVGATIAFGIIQADVAQKQHDSDQAIAKQQYVNNQAIALDQQRAAILQTYIDNIQDLLLNHNLLESKPTEDVAVLARARTLTALQGLDADRKGFLVQFIYEARLIGLVDNSDKTHNPVIDLTGANLNLAALYEVTLRGADFQDVTLNRADLGYTDLIQTDLANANFTFANLGHANVSRADLREAILDHADLIEANFIRSDLTSASLYEADLRGADFRGANLYDTDFYGADLYQANLIGDDLRNVFNLTQKQLDQVFSCKGAILPNGLTCHRSK